MRQSSIHYPALPLFLPELRVLHSCRAVTGRGHCLLRLGPTLGRLLCRAAWTRTQIVVDVVAVLAIMRRGMLYFFATINGIRIAGCETFLRIFHIIGVVGRHPQKCCRRYGMGDG